MPVLRQVPRSEVTDETVLAYYNRLFGDRDPVADANSRSGFRYGTELKLDADASISPLAAPNSTVRVAELLP